MSDVFISYASEDRERAARLAEALGARGWSVWWDRKIIAGQAFDQAIERELEAARSVVVLWSQHAVASEWVKNEAAVAAERGVLVPAMLDPVKLPLEFRRKQTVDLTDWQGDPAHAGFQALCEGVAAAGAAPAGQPAPSPAPPPPARRRPRGLLVAGVVGALLLAFGLYTARAPHGGTPRDAAPATAHSAPQPAGADRPGTRQPAPTATAQTDDLAALVAGRYAGDVIADAKGSSRSNVVVTVTRLDPTTVRVSSPYARLGSAEVPLTRSGRQIVSAEGDNPFLVDLAHNPPALTFNPRNEVAFAGRRQP